MALGTFAIMMEEEGPRSLRPRSQTVRSGTGSNQQGTKDSTRNTSRERSSSTPRAATARADDLECQYAGAATATGRARWLAAGLTRPAQNKAPAFGAAGALLVRV